MKQFRRRATGIAVHLLVLATASCTALGPDLMGLAGSTPTPRTELHWSVVEIPKPTQVSAPTPAAAAPTQAAVPPEDAVLAAEVYPTPEPPTGPQITMEIVEDVVLPPRDEETSEPVSASGKYVLVSIGEQHMYAYENGDLIYSFVASTGMGNSTRVGTFQVLDKIPSAYGSTWNIWMPNWMGIYWSGTLENGIHALPILPGGGRLWSGYLGTPISYGCVVLGEYEASLLYDWAEVGTPVEIRW
jgi:lipoprotein-anchoring transpeptidase ErfK/SrfK